MELARATLMKSRHAWKELNNHKRRGSAQQIAKVARMGGNVFEELMETTKVSSLGQITDALFAVGGQYRRNM